MADYMVSGKKGNGKSLVCVGRMRDAIMQARVVATNLDLNLDKMLPHHLRNTRVYRVPDRPTRADLDMLGKGSDSVDESTYGVLVLDELATWLNARTFNDGQRQGVLDWLVHSRKLGWETYLICQNPNQIDKQVREALCEYHVVCRRLDRIRLSFLPFTLPRIHVGIVRFGTERDSIVADRWIYRGTDLFAAYDTRQVFKPNYEHGLYCYLPPWHLVGHKEQKKKRFEFRQVLKNWFHGPARPVVPPKPKLPTVERLMSLPPDARVPAMRHLGLAA